MVKTPIGQACPSALNTTRQFEACPQVLHIWQSRGACPVPLSRALHDTPSAKLYSQPCLWHALQHQPPQAADNESIIRFSGAQLAQLAQLHSEQRQSSELFINCQLSSISIHSSLVLSCPLSSVAQCQLPHLEHPKNAQIS
jgi:hypothetical protein